MGGFLEIFNIFKGEKKEKVKGGDGEVGLENCEASGKLVTGECKLHLYQIHRKCKFQLKM